MTALAALLAADPAPTLPAETGIGGLLGGGSIAAVSLTIILFIVRSYVNKVDELTKKYEESQETTREDLKEHTRATAAELKEFQQAQTAEARDFQRQIVGEFKSIVEGVKEDARRRDDQFKEIVKEQTAALEYVADSTKDTKLSMASLATGQAEIKTEVAKLAAGQAEIRTEVKDLTDKVKRMDSPKESRPPKGG